MTEPWQTQAVIANSFEGDSALLKNTKTLAAALVGLGMLLGYAAASGNLNPALSANASAASPNATTGW